MSECLLSRIFVTTESISIKFGIELMPWIFRLFFVITARVKLRGTTTLHNNNKRAILNILPVFYRIPSKNWFSPVFFTFLYNFVPMSKCKYGNNRLAKQKNITCPQRRATFTSTTIETITLINIRN